MSLNLPPHWRVIPVGPDKRPLLRHWPERAVPAADTARVSAWLRGRPHVALALVTGPESDVLVIDVDTAEGHGTDGVAALARLEEEYGTLPETATARTPSGGRHLFFRWPAGVARIPSRPLVPGVDVRASRACVVLPTGERTPGRRWECAPDGEPAELPVRWRAAVLPPPPRVDLHRPRPPVRIFPKRAGAIPAVAAGSARDGKYAAAALASACERVSGALPGTRHTTLFREAASLARLFARGLDPLEAETSLAAAACAAGLPMDEAERTIRDAFARGAAGI